MGCNEADPDLAGRARAGRPTLRLRFFLHWTPFRLHRSHEESVLELELGQLHRSFCARHLSQAWVLLVRLKRSLADMVIGVWCVFLFCLKL